MMKKLLLAILAVTMSAAAGVASSDADLLASMSILLGSNQRMTAATLRSWLTDLVGSKANKAGDTFTGNVNLSSGLAYQINGVGIQVYALTYGVKAGNADDTATLQAAIDAVNAAGGGTVILPAGTINVAGVVLKSTVYLKGAGRAATVLKLKNSANVDVMYGLNAYSLFGTLSASGIFDWGLSDLTIDGNRSNNSSGNCLAVYGYRYQLNNIVLQNCAERGLTSEGGQPVAGPMEASINNVLIDTVGKQAAYFNGPHDSVIDNLIVIDAGQLANNTYDGMFFDTYMNARVKGFHGWHRSTVTNRVRAQFYDTSGASNFSESHFEGAYFANLILAGTNSSFDASNMYYAAWNGLNVVIRGPGNTLMGVLAAPGAGRPASVGVTLGFGSDNAGANIIDVASWTNTAGAIDFTHSAGNNRIHVSGYQASGPKYVGSPAGSDEVDLYLPGGATGADLHQHLGNWNLATGSSYQINGANALSVSTLSVPTNTTPASAAAACTKGDIVWDTGFVYVCTATNTWKRAAIATW